MPTISLHETDRNGDYSISLGTAPKHEFYGQRISELQAFRRYGNLPDNHILSNKLINILGRNLLSLEKQAIELEGNRGISEPRKKSIQLYSDLERGSNAFHISLLDMLAPLEMTRETDGSNIVKCTSNQIGLIKNLFDVRITTLKNELFSETNLSQIAVDRKSKLIAVIEANKDSILKMMRTESGVNLQTLHRRVMESFAKEQKLISIFQHRAGRPLDYANQSLTEAYQNASYAMEKHVFSHENPTAEQLWIHEGTQGDTNSPITVDTRRYHSMRKEDALYTACFLGADYPAEEQKHDVLPGAEGIIAHPTAATNPNRKFNSWKDKIKEKSKKNRAEDEKGAREKQTEAELPLRPIELSPKPQGRVEQLSRSEQAEQTSPMEHLRRLANEVILPPSSETPSAQYLASEKHVHLHESHDLFAAIGYAAVDITKYFEGEMAAKKPVMTAAMFIAVGATFGAAGLGAAGVHSMQGLSATIAKILTINGKLGVSPEHFQSVIHAISDKWLELTYSKEGLFHIMLMDMFALPKITYTLVDSILNSSEHKDTISRLTERFASQDLAGYTDQEQKDQLVRNAVTISLMLGGAIALGLAADLAVKFGPGLAKTIGHGVGALSQVPLEAFTSFGGAHTLGGGLVSLLALTLTVKSAGLFIGKMLLVLNHLKEVTDQERQACVLMSILKEADDNAQLSKDLSPLTEDGTFKKCREQFQQLIARNPEIKKTFGAEFLNKIGIQNPELTRTEKAKLMLSSVRNGLYEYGWKKTIKAGLQMVSGTALIAVGMGSLWNWDEQRKFKFNQSIQGFWKWLRNKENENLSLKKHINMIPAIKNPSDPYGLKEGAWNFARLATNIGMATVSGLKTITVATYGLLERAALLSSDIVFDVIAFAGYAFKSPTNLLGALLILAPAKIAAIGLSIANEIVNFAVIVAKYAASALMYPVAGIIGGLMSGIARLFSGKERAGKIWETTKSIGHLPIDAGDAYKEVVFSGIKNFLENATHNINEEVYKAENNRISNIMSYADTSALSISRAFNWVKTTLGKAAYAVRTAVVRRQDHLQQERGAAEAEAKASVQALSQAWRYSTLPLAPLSMSVDRRETEDQAPFIARRPPSSSQASSSAQPEAPSA